MACMDHECAVCGHAVMDNNRYGPVECANCGSTKIISVWDEAADYDPDDDYAVSGIEMDYPEEEDDDG